MVNHITVFAIGITLLVTNYNKPKSSENKACKKFKPKSKTEGELSLFKDAHRTQLKL